MMVSKKELVVFRVKHVANSHEEETATYFFALNARKKQKKKTQNRD